MRLDECLLHEVGCIHLALQTPADLQPGQDVQVAVVLMQKLADRFGTARSRLIDQFVWIIVHSTPRRDSLQEKTPLSLQPRRGKSTATPHVFVVQAYVCRRDACTTS